MALAVLLAMLVSAVGGFLLREYRLSPYRFLKGAWGRLHLTERHSHAGVAAKAPRHTRVAARDTPASDDAIDRLANLPYLRGYRPATGKGGVRAHDRGLAQNGLNFFTSSDAPVATLMNMDGKVVRTWTADAGKAFPYFRKAEGHGHPKFLRDAELLPDGGIVGMFDQIGVVRLDRTSRLRWAWRGPVHHDLFVGPTGTIWAITHERRPTWELRDGKAVMEDFLVELSPEGKLQRRLSLIECFQRSHYLPLLANVSPRAGEDVFHTNSVTVLDGILAGRLPAFRRGNLLVSIKNLNTIAVVDPDAGAVIWALTGTWRAQHCARLLSTGRLLIFDNLGTMRAASRALEIDPLGQQVLWSFGGRPGQELLSETVGYVQRLSNGNTLITESNYGRVVEVTPDHRVVWEFVNPARVGRRKHLVAIVYFMERVSPNLPFLASPDEESSEPPVSSPH